MAKKQLDEALKYMIELDINPSKDVNGVFNRIEDRFGKGKAKELKDAYLKWIRAIDQKEVTTESYNALQALRDESMELSIAYAGACEGDIFRKECNWIAENKEAFGETILCIGRDRGIIAGFLAKELPEAKITVMTTTEEMSVVVRALCEKIGVTNVSVAQKDKDEIAVGSFDTVLSADTAIFHAGPELEDLDYIFIREQGLVRRDAYLAWAEELSSYIKKGGNFISIEVMERNRDYLGWLYALNEASLNAVAGSHTEFWVFDYEGVLNMQAVQFVKDEKKNEMEVLSFFGSIFVKELRADVPKYDAVPAEVMVQICAKELLWGYYIYNMNGEKAGKMALYSSHADNTEMLFYQAMKGSPIEVMRFPYNEKNLIIDQLEFDAREASRDSWRLHRIMFDQNGNEVMVD